MNDRNDGILQIRGFLRKNLRKIPAKKSRNIQDFYQEFQEFLHWGHFANYFFPFFHISVTRSAKVSFLSLNSTEKSLTWEEKRMFAKIAKQKTVRVSLFSTIYET